MKKALIVTPTAHNLGGVEAVNSAIEGILTAKKFDVSYLTLDGIGKVPKKIISTVGAPLFLSARARPAIKDYNIVIANGEHAWGLSGANVVQVNHGCYSGILEATSQFISKRNRLSLKRMEFFQNQGSLGCHSVAVSHDCADLMNRNGAQVNEVIQNGIDLNFFSRKDGEIRNLEFLAVANFSDYYRKGIDVLEKLADQGLQIHCVGTRPDNGSKSRIIYLGRKNRREMRDLYRRTRFFIMPSRYEGLQLAPLEALACGATPIITKTGLGLEHNKPDGICVISKQEFLQMNVISERIRASKSETSFSTPASGALCEFGNAKFAEKWSSLIDRIANGQRCSDHI